MEAALQGVLHSTSVIFRILASNRQDILSRNALKEGGCNSFL